MIRFLLLVLVGATAAHAQNLEPGSELTLPPPWKDPVALGALSEGHYRLEATTLAADPVEFVLERGGSGAWVSAGTNRTLRGALEVGVELSAASAERWRVRPVRSETVTVILKLRRSAFAGLRETLKQDLTPAPEATSPLRKRLELPPGTGGPGLAAALGPSTVWVGWLTDGGWGAEVWDAVRGRRLGPALAASQPWNALSLQGGSSPRVTLTGPGATTARVWNGVNWVVEAAARTETLVTPWGAFRTEGAPPRVLRSRTTGWEDLALPRDDAADRVLLGSTDDGLAAFLASSTNDHRALYVWRPERGWLALPPPPASGPPWVDLWAVTAGAGSLYHLEGGDTLVLRRFDGSQWQPGLDLSSLAPRGARAAALLPPSSWSKTGSLVLVTDRVAVYDLP